MQILTSNLFDSLNFSASEFVGQNYGIPLSEFRAELLSLLDEQKNKLTSLINRDYKDFISLSKNLNGVDTHIDNLIHSLEIIHSNSHKHETHICSSILNFESKLNQRSILKLKVKSMKSRIKIQNSMERLASNLQSIKL